MLYPFKKAGFLFLLVFFVYGFFWGTEKETGVLKLSRFLEKNLEIESLKGAWSIESDSGSGGNSKSSVVWLKDSEKKDTALKTIYELGSQYDFRYAGLKLSFSNAVDLSLYKQISFDLKGNGNRLKIVIGTTDVKDHDYHEYVLVSPSKNWRKYAIPLEIFRQQGFGDVVDLNLKEVKFIQFITGSMKIGEKGWFAINRIELETNAGNVSNTEKIYVANVLNLSDFKNSGLWVPSVEGEWKYFSDAFNRGNSKSSLSLVPNPDNKRPYLKFDYKLDKGYLYRYAVARFAFPNPVNLSKYNTISFRMKGSGNRVKVQVVSMGIPDFDYHATVIPTTSPEWKEYKISFRSFSQEIWGKKTKFSLKNVRGIQFQCGSMAIGEKGWIALDKVTLSREDIDLMQGGFKIHKAITNDKQTNGCFLGVYSESYSTDMEMLNFLETKIGKKFAQLMWFLDWNSEFPEEECERVSQAGYIPHLTWEPWISGETNSIKLSDVISGRWDDYIRKWAASAKEYGKPFFLRWGHEFNGNWYPWSLPMNNMDLQKYNLAYRHVHDIVTASGCTNAIWIWCINNYSSPPYSNENLTHNYPGSNYVDWLAIDGYNFGLQPGSDFGWFTFDELFSEPYTILVQNFPNKPIMLGEFSSGNVGGNKKEWIYDMANVLKEKYPAIKSIVWFNMNKEAEWQIDLNPEISAAFYEAVSNDYFLTSGANLLKVNEKIPEERQLYLDKLKLLSPESEKKTATAKRLKKKIVIDGNLSDWPSDIPAVELSRGNGHKLNFSKSGKSEDIKAKIRMAWDDESFYVGCEVFESTPMANPYRNQEAWKGDCLELMFGLNPDADTSRRIFFSDDYQILFSTADLRTKKAPYIWNFTRIFAGDGDIKVLKTKDGYSMEAKLLFSSFDSFTPEKGKRYGFDIAIDDADTSNERQSQLFWNGSKDFYKNPSVWGFLELK